jgi:hypothetical protein
VQSVHILRDEPEPVEPLLHLRDGFVGGVGAFGGDEFTPPVIPFPHEAGITREGFGCGQILRAKSAPESVGPAKGRHAAVGGNPGSGEHGHRSCRGQLLLNQTER